MPAPDLAVVPGLRSDYVDTHPTTALLVVEIAVTSLRRDKTRKAPLYARQGVRELWVVDANKRKAWVYTGPTADGWSSTVEVGPQDPLTTPAIPGLTIKLGELE